MKKKKAKSGEKARPVTCSQHNHHPHRSPPRKKVVVKQYEEIPNRFRASIDPLNLEEQKLNFLKHGKIPHFQFKVTPEKIEELSHTKRAEIEFDLLDVAVQILEKVRQKYGTGNLCVEAMYGERISTETASRKLCRYLQQNGADGYITVGWTKDQACSAKMAWCGPSTRANRPEARKYSLWLKDSTENQFLRERGILCLADHEIGTHFLRTLNEGLQPWYSSREDFGLRRLRSPQLQETEEGLATINTLVQASQRYLWIPALIYYTACKAATMSFEELFNHLGHFIENREQRWRYVMRVKRSLPDPAGVGGYGNDQCYFKGAVEILRNLEHIDFHLLYAGKVCVESLPRIQRTARLDCLRLPHFLQDMEAYRKILRVIAALNGLGTKTPHLTMTRALKEKKARVRRTSSKKRRKGKTKESDGAQKTLTDDEGCSRQDRVDDGNEGDVEDVFFQRTYVELAHTALSEHHISGESASEVRRDEAVCLQSTPNGRKTSTEKPGVTAPRHLGRPFTTSTDEELRETCRTSAFYRQHLNSQTEIRCQSQPNFPDCVDEVHPTVKALTPSPHVEQHSPPRLALPQPTHVRAKPNGLPASTSSSRSSSQCSGFKWGVAERMESPLSTGMPNVSSRFNREQSTSPVPFSPHRWLLWRRGKRSPNTLNP